MSQNLTKDLIAGIAEGSTKTTALVDESGSINTTGFVLKNLDSSTITLTGRHLIEASAGTGKTYNITRIYLRLLLERELTVEQILLMTFTKDATQELRGRIDSIIREALNNWATLCEEDSYFRAIDEKVTADKRLFLLKRALLFLDEAAIFTIHGFCQRVLNQHAFSSGLPFNANMAADTQEITLQACQDFYRQLAKQNEQAFLLLSEFWSTPDSFLSSFSKAIGHSSELNLIDESDIAQHFIHLAKQAKSDIDNNATLLEEALILVKKGADQEKRRSELADLLTWLTNLIILDEEQLKQELTKLAKMPDAFIDGRRYGRSAFKVALQAALEQVNALKEQAKKIAGKLNKAKAYQLVKQGIYQIRQQVIENKQRLNMLDFDDLINTLAECLTQADTGKNDKTSQSLADTLLAQYPVALVDEFQDTDPKQFAILQAIYYGEAAKKSQSALYLIGDPKQAIYGFRGGDIFAYLNARSGCEHHWLMDTNWRSTPAMIAGYNQVFTNKIKSADKKSNPGNSDSSDESIGVFGYGIPYLPVLAGKKSKVEKNKETTDNDKALQFIHFTADDGQESEKVSQSSRSLMAKWCATEIKQLLSSTSNTKSVKPKDIALLVRDGAEARDIKKALFDAGLDSVFLSDRSNLFDSMQAQQLLKVFKGILFLENERLFVAALASGLLGFTSEKLKQLQKDEQAYQTLKFSFVDYRQQWQRQGFITMAISLMHQHFVIFNEDKDRCLTNLLHLFEIMQAASQRHHQPQALLHWFEQECSLDKSETEAELRLESDGDLIRIITQHGAKGMEYPYVFVPFATRHKDPLKFGNKTVSYIEYHNEKGELTLSLDGANEAKQTMSDEAYAESIRLLYVAITRAEQRCYVLTTCFDKYHLSPIGKTLQWQADENISENIKTLIAQAPDAISLIQVNFDEQQSDNVEQQLALNDSVDSNSTGSHVSKSHLATELKASQFKGNIERDWWLSSFSALTRNIRHGGISAPDRDSEQDENEISTENTELDMRFTLTKGAHTGNLLHDILETSDFVEPNWLESMQRPLAHYGELLAQNGNRFTQQDLINWLEEVLATPFIHQDKTDVRASLAMLPINKTLRESEFYFPMNSGNSIGLAKLLTDHRNKNSIGEPWSSYAVAANLPSYKKLFGMMHGFIDLVFECEGKYYVCDYKSSHLGDKFSDYNEAALKTNMESNYYDLQYLIYSLALHRYLKASLPNYQPAEHFGGAYYLYLRGMTTAAEHLGAGVYHRQVTEHELVALDKLFAGNDLAKNEQAGDEKSCAESINSEKSNLAAGA